MSETFHIPCGLGKITFTPPQGINVFSVEPKRGDPVDLECELEQALRHPVSGPSLTALAKPGQKVCIVFTDATRQVPDRTIVQGMLRHLTEAGIRREDVTLLCGVGMHRPSTQEEKIDKLGKDIVARYKVADSEPRPEEKLVFLGNYQNIPLWVNHRVMEADLLIATGIVEPHQYAGFSGGRKTVAVGAGGEPTIAATHSPRMIQRLGVRLGNTEGNPFHETLTESARRAGLRFIVNVIKDSTGAVVAVAAGEPEITFRHLVNQARPLYEVTLDRRFDIVVAGVGHPKDANIYQASRAATYIYFAPQQVLKPGGVIIIPAPCTEGAGQGVGEERFFEAMRTHSDPTEVVQSLENKTTLAGEQRSYLLAKALQGCKVIFVGSYAADDVKACHMTPIAELDEAIEVARSWTRRDADLLVAPHALLTILRGPSDS